MKYIRNFNLGPTFGSDPQSFESIGRQVAARQCCWVIAAATRYAATFEYGSCLEHPLLPLLAPPFLDGASLRTMLPTCCGLFADSSPGPPLWHAFGLCLRHDSSSLKALIHLELLSLEASCSILQ